MKYGTINLGQIEAAINKLGGQDVFERLLTCNSVNVTFSDGNAEVVARDPITSVWKTITIGSAFDEEIVNCARKLLNLPDGAKVDRQEHAALLFSLTFKERGINVGTWAADIMKQDAFTVSPSVQQVSLANLSVREMGFTGPTRFDTICQWIKEHGELCQAEDGPQLRLQYEGQPLGEWIRVAIKPIRDSAGDLDVFYVGHNNGGLWLRIDDVRPGILWHPDCRFVVRVL